MLRSMREQDSEFEVLKLIRTIVGKLDLDSRFRSRATYFYHKSKKIKDIKRRSKEFIVALNLFLTINEFDEGSSVTFQEILSVLQEMGYNLNQDEILKVSIDIETQLQNMFKYLGKRSEDYLDNLIRDVMNREDLKRYENLG